MESTHDCMGTVYNKILAVLDSNWSGYRIAKELGLKNQTYIDQLRRGESRIENMKLDRAERFVMVYDEHFL